MENMVKEHLALRNNCRVTKKFLIANFNCSLEIFYGHYSTVQITVQWKGQKIQKDILFTW